MPHGVGKRTGYALFVQWRNLISFSATVTKNLKRSEDPTTACYKNTLKTVEHNKATRDLSRQSFRTLNRVLFFCTPLPR